MRTLSARWIRIALLNFLFAALIGIILRFAFVQEIKWLPYKAFQDAHSNLALLGWIFQGIFACFAASFLSENDIIIKKYRIIFLVNQILITVVTLSFLFNLSRILSNTILILLSCSLLYFTVVFTKDAGIGGRGRFSYKLAVGALVFLISSFIGLYAITPVLFLATAKKVLFYYLGVQFFLHFQYNGWFTFAILALVFRYAENSGYRLDDAKGKWFLTLMISGIIANYFLTLYWGYRDHSSYLWISSAGTLLQVAGLIYIRKELKRVWDLLSVSMNSVVRFLFIICILAFGVKLVMQLITTVPFIAVLAFTIRNYVIAYLHLIFIGVMTAFTIGWSMHSGLLSDTSLSRAGLFALLLGFIIMELVLVLQGTMLWAGAGFLSFYYELIFFTSILLPSGLLLLLASNVKNRYSGKMISL